MNPRRWLVVGAVLIAITGAYFLGRIGAPKPPPIVRTGIAVGDAGTEAAPGKLQASAAKSVIGIVKGAPLPAPGTPLKDTFADLQARANNGDVGAATRLYHDLSKCSHLRGSEWKNAGEANDLTSKKTENMTPAQLRTYQAILSAMELRQQADRKNQELCDGVGDEMLGSLVDNIAQAARLGDEDARACYLGQGPLYDARSMLKHPESLRNYRSNASALIEAGLTAGDWRVVDLLQQAYEPGSQSLLAGLVGADPVQHYRYLKLYRLGAEQHRVARLDQQLAAVASNLTSGQLAEADEWAQRTLQDNFEGSSTNTTPPGWEACEF
ncbi:hypothetical protein [Luteimonas panaciterrae]|uniref:hypothetical protein n=1 Tax=Luteimonas panaciterrae TaxID=363885 RepID=UPI001CF95DDD|nr:hypothetical protein [Luteimonas panaciterrae]